MLRWRWRYWVWRHDRLRKKSIRQQNRVFRTNHKMIQHVGRKAADAYHSYREASGRDD